MSKRKAHYTPRIGEQICEEIALGATVQQALDRVGYLAPDRITFYRWLEAHPEFREKYDRARQLQADSHADRIVELGDEVLKNPKFAPAFKVAIDTMRWSAEVRNRGKYGAKGEAAGKAKLMNAEKLRAEIKRLEKELGVVSGDGKKGESSAAVIQLAAKRVAEG